ncbi:hypothetical protein MKW92_016741 [Papaver armeniacum]|nr:hypothetical protein MKW92_016741 [Papaver armeniacum]
MKKPSQKSPQTPPSEEEKIITSSRLPDDAVLHILSKLPVKSIVRFRCVCKHWCYNLFKDPNLVKSHINRSIQNQNFTLLIYYNPVKESSTKGKKLSGNGIFTVNLAGSPSPLSPRKEGDLHMIKDPFKSKKDVVFYSSCNGLVLMNDPWSEEESDIMLWNPSTAEIKQIPKPVDDDDHPIAASSGSVKNCECSHLFGLEYSGIDDDYKILRLEVFFSKRNGVCHGCEVKVYTLRTNSWKTIPYEFSYDLYLGSVNQMLFRASGALHWMQAPCASLPQGNESVPMAIVSFDVEHDIFKQVPLTSGLQELLISDDPNKSYTAASRLGNFDGCLSVILGNFFSIFKAGEVSIWVMKEYGVRESWTKMYSVTNHSMMRSMRYLKMVLWDFIHGMLLFLKDDSKLVLYDPKHELAIDMDIGGFSPEDYYSGCMETYLESFVSLNSGTYLGQNVITSEQGKKIKGE